jgi:hypothetical protein
MTKTLDTLVPGDRVAVGVSKRIGRDTEKKFSLVEVAVVERMTPTQIIVHRHKYSRTTGHEIGLGSHEIIPASEEHEKIWQTKQELRRQHEQEHQASQQRKRDLENKFPEAFRPHISDYGEDKIELSFQVTWAEAALMAKALAGALR